MATVAPHMDGFIVDPIKVAGASTSTAQQKRTRAKAQMAEFDNASDEE